MERRERRRRQLTLRAGGLHALAGAGGLALLALACSTGTGEAVPPEVVRALAEDLASGVDRQRVMVVDEMNGAALPFDARQALVTAGFRVDAPAAPPVGAFLLRFERATREGDGWRVWTRRTIVRDAAEAEAPAAGWLVTCARSACVVGDSISE